MSQLGFHLSPVGTVARGPAIKLRDYQQDCIAAIKSHLAQGRRRLLVAIATGGGKTIVFAMLYQALGLTRRMLVLAHREELLDQAARKLQAANPSLRVGIEQAQRHADSNAEVLVASVPTLQRQRLAALRPDDFGLVVTDEAHHAVSPSYRAIYEHLGCLGPDPRIPHIGVTATPNRGDKIGLGAVFEAIAFRRGIQDLISAGWLCPVHGLRVSGSADLSQVKTRAGEFVTSQLAEAVDTPERNAVVVRAYLDHTPGQRAITFAADVAHAQHLAESFRGAEVPAECVHGQTPKDERRDILDRFATGELHVVTNCGVLTEGFDCPEVAAILMARPTKSQLLYTQMIGRGTRRAAGKSHLTVIDLADNSGRHSLASIGSLFGLPPDFDAQGNDVLRVKAELDDLAERYPWLDVGRLAKVGDIKAAAQRVDLFFEDRTPAQLDGMTRLAWLPAAGEEGYRLSLPGEARESLQLQATLIDTWQVVLTSREGKRRLFEYDNLRDAIGAADQWVAQERYEAMRVVQARAGWRFQPASDKQLAVLRRRGVPIPATLTKGQASRIIDMSNGRRGPARRWI